MTLTRKKWNISPTFIVHYNANQALIKGGHNGVDLRITILLQISLTCLASTNVPEYKIRMLGFSESWGMLRKCNNVMQNGCVNEPLKNLCWHVSLIQVMHSFGHTLTLNNFLSFDVNM